MWEGLLPIGSVVLLKGAERKLMIISAGALTKDNEEDEGTLYDYSSVLFPYGYIDRSQIYLFNRDDIETICSVGYMDDEFYAVTDGVAEAIEAVRAGEMPMEELARMRPARPEVLPLDE